MAFEITAGEVRDTISHEEEEILALAVEIDSKRFPELSWLGCVFFDDPKIDPERAQRLSSEIDALATEAKGSLEPPLLESAARLATFFRAAGESGAWVHCQSE